MSARTVTCVAVLLVATVVVGGCRPLSRTVTVTTRNGGATQRLPAPGSTHEPTARELGQLIVNHLPDDATPPQIEASLRADDLSGLLVDRTEASSSAQLQALTRRLQAADAQIHDPGLLIAADQEGGASNQYAFLPPASGEPELGRTSLAQVRSGALAAGLALSRVGVNLALAPVADLADAPTMAPRSFGTVPDAVGADVAADVRGMQAGGIAATAKHFPGFGAAALNTDDGVVHISHALTTVRDRDDVPFAAAISAGVDVVMVSHAIEPWTGGEPASISPAALSLLHGLGFRGVAITDSMQAQGLVDGSHLTVPQACVRAIRAGEDMVLLTGGFETAHLCRIRIADAVRAGTIPLARVDEALARVRALKRHLRLA